MGSCTLSLGMVAGWNWMDAAVRKRIALNFFVDKLLIEYCIAGDGSGIGGIIV